MHCRICKTRGVGDHTIMMVDITAFKLKHESGAALWQFVEKPGANSIQFLARLAVVDEGLDLRKMEPVDIIAAGADERVIDYFTHDGPALVTKFRTNDNLNFDDTGRHVHVGADGSLEEYEEVDGTHAMTLVGWRGVPAAELGGVRYLVQNWWERKQFIECDLAYLASRQARLAWVMPNVDRVPAHFPLTHRVYGETDLDGPDIELQEGY